LKPKLRKLTSRRNRPKQRYDPRKSELSKIDSETADALKEIHKTFATKAKTKFNFYMKTAEVISAQRRVLPRRGRLYAGEHL
jgi:hypothetical protein